MGYLSKELIEKCYLTMYGIAPENTPSDGRVQLVSALRHFVSIDRYEKLYHSHCDGKITSDKARFAEIVKEVVSISDGYVANFAEKINVDKDCKVSTNLFGGSSYLKSVGDDVLYSLPKNKNFPLINMKNGCLISNKDYYSNIDHYLQSQEVKVAFVLWLVRNEVLISLSYNVVYELLLEKYTQELVSCILPDKKTFDSYVDGFELEDSVTELSAEDLLRIFNSKHNTITDPIDFMQLKEEIAKELSKDELTDILAKIFNNINVSAAGGVFTFMLGDKVVDKFSASELMEAASKKSPKAKYRYNAELSAAYEMFRFFKGHPELLYINCQQQRQGNTGNLPFQKIVYGAPGTGKSYGTDGKIHDTYEKCSTEEKEHVFRTTFHPDSDYSTFVGCYKPTRISTNILNEQQLIIELQRLIANDGDYAVDQLGYNYWESFEYDINKEAILKACGKGSQVSHLNSGIALGKRFQKKNGDITYDFVPQAFTKAYIKAWEEKILVEYAKKNEEQKATLLPAEDSETKKYEAKPVFLVIEEINRGNCAQIFGDLFQLLDRNDDRNDNRNEYGMSCYPIKPDTDLGNYIAGELRKFAQKHNINIDTCSYKEIINGEEMLLPDNLYIWATMNTSDQSLFPIDSAFKRRWDWEYVPISKGFDRENKKDIEYKIKIGDYDCDWWQFIQAINKEIGETTKSEDKKLGFYFCKADKNIIDEKKFVGKVIFYLWNDVFKDYETDIFDMLEEGYENPTFEMFYKSENGETSINENMVKSFIDKVLKKHPEVLPVNTSTDNNPSGQEA